MLVCRHGPAPLHMLGLDEVSGTPLNGITAPVLCRRQFRGAVNAAAGQEGRKGRSCCSTTRSGARHGGRQAVAASAAARRQRAAPGAVATLIRSTHRFPFRVLIQAPLRYDSTVAKTPAAALRIEDAELLHRMQNRGAEGCRHASGTACADAARRPIANAIAELRGSEAGGGGGARRPHRLVGRRSRGRWTRRRLQRRRMGSGPHLMKQRSDLRPKRTVRVVLWTNEEKRRAERRSRRTATRTPTSWRRYKARPWSATAACFGPRLRVFDSRDPRPAWRARQAGGWSRSWSCRCVARRGKGDGDADVGPTAPTRRASWSRARTSTTPQQLPVVTYLRRAT